MNYKIFNKDGELVNTIYATEAFAIRYCEVYGYTYELIPEPEPEPEPEPTTAELLNILLGVEE